MTDKLLEAKELAERLGVPENWVRQQTRAGAIPHVKLGRYRRYDLADVEAWLEACKRGGTPGWRKYRPKQLQPTGGE